MAERIELQSLLENILNTEHVYFQPPETVKLEYPCIVYKRSSDNVSFADNTPYNRRKMYAVTVIDPNPDSVLPDQVANLPFCSFSRHYTADNLNHDVYNIFY